MPGLFAVIPKALEVPNSAFSEIRQYSVDIRALAARRPATSAFQSLGRPKEYNMDQKSQALTLSISLMSAAVAVFTATYAGDAVAETAFVDTLWFYKNNNAGANHAPFQSGDLVMQDNFNNGNPAVSDTLADGTTYSYSYLIARQAPIETNGFLKIAANFQTTIASPNAVGVSTFSTGVRLLTNGDPNLRNTANKLAGLGRDTDWSVGAVFGAQSPSQGSGYMVRLSDFGIGTAANQGNDILQLQLFGGANGPELRLVHQDFLAGTRVTLWSDASPFPAGTTEIAFGFGHNSPNTNTVNAYYEFFAGATPLGFHMVPVTSTIYTGELLTRLEIFAFAPVPEPAVPALWSMGALALGLVQRLRKR
jgi:hypothetical protein